MAKKTVDRVKASLKLRANPRQGALSLRIGQRKYTLPFEVRQLKSDDYIFVHIPPSAEILRLGNGSGLEIVDMYDEAKEAQASFRRRRSKRARSRKQVEMPAEISDALKNLPKGYKLGYDSSGKPKLVKKRKRSAG